MSIQGELNRNTSLQYGMKVQIQVLLLCEFCDLYRSKSLQHICIDRNKHMQQAELNGHV